VGDACRSGRKEEFFLGGPYYTTGEEENFF